VVPQVEPTVEAALKVCNEPGCHELSTGSKCELHHKQQRKQTDSKRPNARARGYDNRWQRTRAAYLKAFPYCQSAEGCIRPAVDVHHIDGLGPSGPLGHSWGNLQGLCHSHHSKLTAQRQHAH
jgi:5-methylcytosine-specific restriction protein A